MTETAWNEPDRYPMELEFQSLSYEESGKTPILAQHGTKTFVIYGLNKQPVKGCSTHILSRDHRINHCLFHTIDRRQIDGIKRLVIHHLDVQKGRGTMLHRSLVGGGKSDKNIARIVTARRSVTADADACTTR